MTSLRFVACALPLAIVAFPAFGPAARADRFDKGSPGHGATPAGRLSEAEDVAIALTAAPASITAGAAVDIQRNGKFAQVRDGSTGWVCLVGRDPRVNPVAVAPQCYNPEGAARQCGRGCSEPTCGHAISATRQSSARSMQHSSAVRCSIRASRP